AALARLAAPLARFEHPAANALWHPMNQAREAAHAIEPRAISRLARHLLALADPGAIAARRRENFATLAGLLPDLALIPDAADFVPLGFPVRLPPARRDAVLARLHAQGFFPAVHWRSLPVGRDWAREWAWADSLATLPCDPRATPADLRALAAALRAALGDGP
ncbi:MAG: hypothetical protein IE927_11840, partial [Rhodobacterales bacterium]|nr:hypothetical protein [Rhodobacterales bacterium]